MRRYALAYRLGVTPWERYSTDAASSIGILLDREESDRSRPLGRALDLGCGRGQFAPELARRGWEVVGVDNVPRAVAAAERKAVPGASFVVGDATDLESMHLGTFDLFFDVGCLQGLGGEQRLAVGRGVTALARPGATLLVLAFGATALRSVIGGVTRQDVATAFPEWDVVAVDAADTTGLGWPMSRTSPEWHRLRLRS
jgi:SAM-dependent methyltransferase